MRIIVFGAGAIGSVLSARLARTSHEVVMIARGPHLDAIRRNRLHFEDADGATHQVAVPAEGAGAPLTGAVLVTLKSYALPGAAEAVARHRAAGGLAVFLQNGLPWWYFRGLDGPMRDRPLPSLDPGGSLAGAFPAETTAGGVVSLSASLVAPGHVRHTGGFAISMGMVQGGPDPSLAALGAALAEAGFEVALPSDPRPAVWTKLTINVALNGVAALTGASIGGIWADDGLRRLVHHLADEAMAIAAALHCPVTIDLEQRRRDAVGSHRSSTLQDIEAGRPIEYEALFGALLPIARELAVPIPHIEAVAALLRRRALEVGCLPP